MPRFSFLGNRKKLWLSGSALFAVLLGAWLWHRPGPAPASNAQPAIPVETSVAALTDAPVYLDGLGAVQAFNTITVTTRVDGQLQRINFVEGQEVKTGDVLAQIDSRPYQAVFDQAVATEGKDQAQLANARLDLQRFATLAPQNYTSKQSFDTQRALVAQLEAQTKFDQAVIDSAKTNLDYTTIRSPIDGRTGIRQVDAGNNLVASANTGLVVVTQLRPISVVVTLPEEELAAIRSGMANGPLTAIGLSRDGNTELDRGTIAVLDNQINQATGTARLKATFPNAKETLWPGDFVNVKVLVRTEKNVVTVPAASVQRGPDGLYVYVVKPDTTVEIRPISLQQFNDGAAVVSSGLQPGETVVSAGQYRLQPGAHIQATAPATSDHKQVDATEKSR
ncbi:MAG: efflux transporter periplasmic adaptor subunit [Rhodospirillales bacterium]|nr:efflux transporter periplasmic adaptor subunit [Rhodospirillales bacterium]